MTDLVEFTICDANGYIVRTGVCPSTMIDLQNTEAGETQVSGAGNALTQYVDLADDNTIKSKGTLSPTWSSTTPAAEATITLTGLPSHAVMVIDGKSRHVVTDGSISLSFGVAGTYVVTVSTVAYLDYVETIVVS